ncbi:MAG: HAMP domain-containing histidine kinase [Oscillospiraceae bacterium]|nr:HAMP domain-containing histidine kinase [Oscillospiraceae bacterium]
MHTRESNPVSKFAKKYFDASLDLRVQAFHLLAFAGIAVSAGSALFMAATDGGLWHVALNLLAAGFAYSILRMAKHTGRYRLFRPLTVIAVFIVLFPLLYFTGNGYGGNMPMFFVLAIVFTALMLEGWARAILISAEFLLYTVCYLVEYRFTGPLAAFATEYDHMLSILVGLVSVGIMLFAVVTLYMRIYNNQQKQLEKANHALEELNRMKTEFLQDMSHEMQNPLTTITRCIGHAGSRLELPDGLGAARDVLNIAEDEALRLGRMVASMVNLAAMSGSAEGREKINFAEILSNCAEMFRLQLNNRGNALHVDIDPGLPPVYGIADSLKQVPINLLANAARHTGNGAVTLEASLESGFITVVVRDTGEGIPPELLPRVFERGVSSNKSPGYGLSICRTIVEAHGGEIQIESEQGKGTAVTFTIPAYGGQSEARRHE